MIPRDRERRRIEHLLTANPVVALLGARQVGKSTLARQVRDRRRSAVAWFDLEHPGNVAMLSDPLLALERLRGLVVIDEVQRRPELFPVLRVLADRPGSTTRFLILGSASPALLRQGSETLAGRIAFHELMGLATDEVGVEAADRLWSRGGFPRSFLARSEADSADWRREFVKTFVERDLPQLGVQVPSPTMHRFWTMLAHHHAQTWNAAELARAFGVAATTVRRHLDVLTGGLVVRQLQPWHENLGKRQVKAPKVYLADSGLLHTLLGIAGLEELHAHPKVGASWEGFVIGELVRRLGAKPEECFFWATHSGAELDLLVVKGRTRRGFEVKRTTAPSTTRSMHAAIESLGLDRLDVIHAGTETFPLKDNVRAVAFRRITEDIEPIR